MNEMPMLRRMAVGALVGVVTALLMEIIADELHLSPAVRGGITGGIIVAIMGAMRPTRRRPETS